MEVDAKALQPLSPALSPIGRGGAIRIRGKERFFSSIIERGSKRIVFVLNLLLFVLFLFPFLSSCRFTAENTAVSDNNEDSLELVFTGDLLLDRGVRPWAERRGIEWLLDSVSPLFKKADAAIVNLECPITDKVTPQPKQFVFRADVHWVDDLHKAGITHASMANNHSMDQGFQGVQSTYESLKKASITPMGCGKTVEERITPSVITKGDLNVAIFSSVLFPIESWFPNPEGKYSPCQADVATLCSAIRDYKKLHPEHKVIAYLHWGVEYQEIPTQPQRMQAAQIVYAGADAIIGHHPHVVQKMGRIDGKPVFYSLGHLVFDSTRPQGNRGQIARLVVRDDTIMANALDIHIERCKPFLK